MIRTLHDLLTPAIEPTFRDHFARKKPVLLQPQTSRPVASLLPWSEIDRLLSTRNTPADDFRVVVNRNEARQSMYRAGSGNFVRSDALQRFAGEGASFVINAISDQVPAIGALAGAIERELGQEVFANCYISFGASSAFLAHYDEHDVLIVQLHGSKRWQRYGVQAPFPARGQIKRTATGDAIWSGVTAPGDVLYLPRGEGHAAVPDARPSVHLTFGIEERLGSDYLHWLAERAEQDVLFRRELPRDGVDLSQHAERLEPAIAALVQANPVSDYLAHSDRQRRCRQVASFELEGRLAPDSMLLPTLRRRLDFRLDEAGEVEIEIGRVARRLPLEARRMLDLLVRRHALSLAALAEALTVDVSDATLRATLGLLCRLALVTLES